MTCKVILWCASSCKYSFFARIFENFIDEWILITNLRLRYQALVQKELDRAYDDGTHPDAKNLNRDLVERAEEAERMREHIVKEMDKNKDRMISKDEFLERVNLLAF